MNKNSFKKHLKPQAEDAYRLLITVVVVSVVMTVLIRLDTHTFISSKLMYSPDQRPDSEQLIEGDITKEPTSSVEPSVQSE
jgi:hypothetical protein